MQSTHACGAHELICTSTRLAGYRVRDAMRTSRLLVVRAGEYVVGLDAPVALVEPLRLQVPPPEVLLRYLREAIWGMLHTTCLPADRI
jgi:hypothetical protein